MSPGDGGDAAGGNDGSTSPDAASPAGGDSGGFADAGAGTETGSDSGVAEDAGSDANPDASSAFVGVYLNQVVPISGGGFGIVVNNYFGHPGDRCFPQTVAPGCVLIDCLSSQATIAYASAGTFTITSDPGPYTDTPQPNNSYTLINSATVNPWKAGDAVTLTATGGADFGPFTLSVSAYPAAPNIILPAASSTPIAVPRTQPFTVTWTATSQYVEVELEQWDMTDPAENSTALICTVPALLGSYTFPPSLLASFSATGSTMSAEYVVSAVETANLATAQGAALLDARMLEVGGLLTFQ